MPTRQVALALVTLTWSVLIIQAYPRARDFGNPQNETYLCAVVPESNWHNRDLFFKGRGAIRSFLTKKWEMELDYKLVKELW